MAARYMWVAGGLAAVVGIGAGVAFAEGEMGKRGGWHGDRGDRGGMFRRTRTKDDVLERARARFARIDANSDGVADRDEIAAMAERRMERRWGSRDGRRMQRRGQRMLMRFDVDRDGKVTQDEIRTRVAERFARNDIDADGAITDADLPPMMRGQNVLSSDIGWMPRRRWRRRLERLRQANTNGDDRVTLEEAQAMAIKRFGRFDANGDGAIDAADREARQAVRRDYRVSRMLARYGAAGQDSITRDAFLAEIAKRFDRRDLDGDGVLSRSERWSGRGGRGGWRHHGRHDHHRGGWREGRHRYEGGRGERRGWRGEDRGPRGERGRERGGDMSPERELNFAPDAEQSAPFDPDQFQDTAYSGAPGDDI
jgi:Ca2+-binding EF-hand superfamily protein